MEIRAKIAYGYLTPPLPRTVESRDALRQERNDLDEAGYFGKKNPLESEVPAREKILQVRVPVHVHGHVYLDETK